ETATGRDVELQAVPGTDDDLALVGERRPPVALFRRQDRRADVPLAQRAALVEAVVREGVVGAPDVEDADLHPVDPDDALRPGRKILDRPDDVFSHAHLAEAGIISLAEGCPPERRPRPCRRARSLSSATAFDWPGFWTCRTKRALAGRRSCSVRASMA